MLPDENLESPLDRALNAAAKTFREAIKEELGEVPLALLFVGTARGAGVDDNGDGATLVAAVNTGGYSLAAVFAGLTQCAVEAGAEAAEAHGATIIRPNDN